MTAFSNRTILRVVDRLREFHMFLNNQVSMNNPQPRKVKQRAERLLREVIGSGTAKDLEKPKA
jgi:hypothetical protein